MVYPPYVLFSEFLLKISPHPRLLWVGGFNPIFSPVQYFLIRYRKINRVNPVFYVPEYCIFSAQIPDMG
jgi:hypothetical protein